MIGVLSILIVGFGLAYALMTAVSGARFERQHRRRLARGEGDPAADGTEPTTVVFLIGCLDEAAVIAETVRRLLVDERARVVVVDDASDDDTGALARSVDPERVTVLRRELPEARQGKGRALNEGFVHLRAQVASDGLDPDGVVVCVMDADGHLSEGCLDHVLPLFRDPKVGGAQLAVRIRNRRSLLGRIQDVEFYGLTATCQMGRVATGTVSLGGNGQFTRLSALLSLDGEPWSQSLTEDLDLTISMLTKGWLLTSTAGAHVTQEGLEQVGPLIRQRTRWYQGHMTCARRIPELWRTRSLPHGAVLEITAYLGVPWLQVLPWSILFHVGLWQIYATLAGRGWDAFGSTLEARALGLGLWYLLLFFPSIANGYLYFRREESESALRSFALGHALIASSYISYAACWRALGRMLRGRTGWDKTRRNADSAGAAGATAPGPDATGRDQPLILDVGATP